MVDLGAAAGGVIAICVVAVLPLSIVIHLLARRYLFVSTLAVPVVFTGVMLLLCRAFEDRHDPSYALVHRFDMELAWWSFWPALVVSVLAAAPIAAHRLYRRIRPAA